MPGVQCPSCHKLAGLDEPEIEDSSVEVTDAEVALTVTIIRNSTCCGDEIKRADLEGAFEISHECPNADIIGREVYHDGETFEIESGFEADSAEASLEGYTSGGGRYAAMKVGASGSVTGLRCLACGEELEVDVPNGALETTAGSMDVSV